jgi:hypothetical protein
MKESLVGKTCLGLAAAVLLLAVSMLPALAQGGGQNGGGRLEGSWNVRVTVRDCTTGSEVRSFDSVTQFMQGGTLIDSTSAVWQALKTPGQGIWEHTTANNYRFTFKAFSFSTVGAYTGYQIIRHEASMASSGDAYESAGTSEFYTPTGVLVNSLCSTTTATRMLF